MYVLWRGDIWALAEQMADDMMDYWDHEPPKTHVGSMLYALRRAGMTPGKGTQ